MCILKIRHPSVAAAASRALSEVEGGSRRISSAAFLPFPPTQTLPKKIPLILEIW
jgi:hypothetical protein